MSKTEKGDNQTKSQDIRCGSLFINKVAMEAMWRKFYKELEDNLLISKLKKATDNQKQSTIQV